VFINITGETYYLWLTVDLEGEVLETLVSKSRERKVALVYLNKTMKRYCKSKSIVTNKPPSYRAAMKMIVNTSTQKTAHWVSNPAENLTSLFYDENTWC
jgi:putative transposase